MNTWIGSSEANLVSQMGAPNLSATLDGGDKVLTWAIPWTASYPGQPPVQRECRRSFTLSGGTVRAWSYSGCG